MQNKGQALLAKLKDNVACEDKTQDMANLNKAVGYDIHSQEFLQYIEQFIHDHESEYYYLFNQMYKTGQNNQPITLGFEYAIFLDQVAQDANNDEDLEL